MGIIEFDFKSLKDKIENSPSSPTLSQRKTWETFWGRCSSFLLRAF